MNHFVEHSKLVPLLVVNRRGRRRKNDRARWKIRLESKCPLGHKPRDLLLRLVPRSTPWNRRKRLHQRLGCRLGTENEGIPCPVIRFRRTCTEQCVPDLFLNLSPEIGGRGRGVCPLVPPGTSLKRPGRRLNNMGAAHAGATTRTAVRSISWTN